MVEAKDNKHAVGGGIQQAIDYAQILDLKFAYGQPLYVDNILAHGYVHHNKTAFLLC